MAQRGSAGPISKRAIWGLGLICVALPLTFVPFLWAAVQGEGPSSYEATTLIAVPLGTAGLVLSLLAASDVAHSDGQLRGGKIAMVAIALGAIGAAAATPLILGALF